MANSVQRPTRGRVWRRPSRARIAWAVGLALFAWLAMLAHYTPYFDWDVWLAGSIQSLSLPGFTTLMLWVSEIGSGWIALSVVAAAALLLLLAGLRHEALICVTGVGLGAAANLLLKAIIARPRPAAGIVNVLVEYRHESFPSGHTVFFVELFGFLILVTSLSAKRPALRVGLPVLFAGLIALVGVSRVHLGAHWPSDVTGGYLLGGLVLSLMAAIYRARVTNKRNVPAGVKEEDGV